MLALILGSALVDPGTASAHALLQSADPAAGSTVATPPAAVTLTFGEAPDPRLSSVRVRDTGSQDVATGPAQAVPGHPDQLRVALKPLSDGVYSVSWRAVSAVDSHVAAGTFAFGVGVAATSASSPASTGGASSTSGSAAAVVFRWILYLGLIALFGAGFFSVAIDRRPQRSVLRLAGMGWLAAVTGTLAVIAVQWSESGADLSTVVGSSIGLAALERLLAAIAMTIAVVGILLSSPTPSRWRFGLLAATAAAAMLIDVMTGHAAAGRLSAVQVAVQWLHIVAAGLWIGGLAAVLLHVRGAPSDEKGLAVRRFSRWAGYALAIVALTGIVRAIDEVGRIDALLGTDFGRLVVVKSALLGVLALLGATNRFINVPRAARMLAGLRRIGSAEVTLGAVVLLAAGLLVNLVPPSTIATGSAPPPQAPLLTGSDFGTTVRARLAVEPGGPGFNRFTAVITDYDSGAPVAADRVMLRFTLASASSVGPSTLALPAIATGTYAAS